MSVSAADFAQTAYDFRDDGLTYQQYDCIHFVNLVRTTCGLASMLNGTNSLWRSNELYYKDTIANCIAQYGAVPQSALLFKCHPEGTPGYNTIPSRYYGDGIGNFTHVGILTNLGQGVMQSGGYGGTGVHDSSYNWNWWTHVGFQPGVQLVDSQGNDIPLPTPGPGPGPIYQGMPNWFYLYIVQKELKQNVKNRIVVRSNGL